jgi:hypothetical protein
MLTAPSPFLIGKPRLFELLYQAPPFDAYFNASPFQGSPTATRCASRVLIKPSNGFPFAARYLCLSFAANVSGVPTAFDNSFGGGIYVAKWDANPSGESQLPPASNKGPNALMNSGSSVPGDNPVLLKFSGNPTFALAPGNVIRSDMFPFNLAQGDGLVIQISGFVAATFSAPGVRTFVEAPNYYTTIAPGGSGQLVGATLASVACAGLFSVEGMR